MYSGYWLYNKQLSWIAAVGVVELSNTVSKSVLSIGLKCQKGQQKLAKITISMTIHHPSDRQTWSGKELLKSSKKSEMTTNSIRWIVTAGVAELCNNVYKEPWTLFLVFHLT